MRKGSRQTAEARQKMTTSHLRRYAVRGGQTLKTRQKIAETQRCRYAETARLVAFARAVMSNGLPA